MAFLRSAAFSQGLLWSSVWSLPLCYNTVDSIHHIPLLCAVKFLSSDSNFVTGDSLFSPCGPVRAKRWELVLKILKSLLIACPCTVFYPWLLKPDHMKLNVLNILCTWDGCMCKVIKQQIYQGEFTHVLQVWFSTCCRNTITKHKI